MLEIIHSIFMLFLFIMMLYLILFNEKKKNTPSPRKKQILEDIQKIVSQKSDELEYEKKYYKGNWEKVKRWKKNIQEIVTEYQNNLSNYSKEDLIEEKATMELLLNNGLDAIKKNQDPYSVTEKDLLFVEKSPLFDPFFYIISIIPILGIYFMFAFVKLHITLLTFAFSLYLLYIYTPVTKKIDRCHFYLASILVTFTCVYGYVLNQWINIQSTTVQIWVSLLLPVVYGIIYYAIRHKRKVREI